MFGGVGVLGGQIGADGAKDGVVRCAVDIGRKQLRNDAVQPVAIVDFRWLLPPPRWSPFLSEAGVWGKFGLWNNIEKVLFSKQSWKKV